MKIKFNKITFFSVLAFLGVLGTPIIWAGYLLHWIARLLLAISYFLMFHSDRGRFIFKSLFRWGN